MVSEYVDMAKVYEVQSPQIFRRKALAEAYAKRQAGKTEGQTFVDDAELLMGAGFKVATIFGSRLNQRIDSEEMIRLAKDLIAHTPKPKPKTPLNPFGEAEW
jgi:2-C-methyl-D-erythritol 4-phosphate cytidylyltransferase